ncbi:MAG: glutaryl-7-ACA acylase [Pseudoduganella sp.]|jgi:putative CocE/NonD family hydrolase|nr:glutaryl-7-ACA acylase [Pseudoduganella sp.]
MRFSLILSTVLLASQAGAQTSPMAPDIVAGFAAPQEQADYVKRVVMLPMRDGVKLYTVIVVPKGASKAPIILTRTPYNAAGRAKRNVSPAMQAALPLGDEVFGRDFIRVFQDVRGKFGSEGEYVMTRPVRGPLNTSQTDNGTDAWDTIEWLVRNVPETNGKVGMIGSSYEGFTVLMALTEAHPALKAAVPMSAMVDGWRGDDWFHNGAFRVNTLSYLAGQNTARGKGEALATGVYDDYDWALRAGSVAALARQHGLDQLNFTRKLFEHPAYDSFWQEQALDRILGQRKLTVPTLHVVGQWDQEDIYGTYATYAALEKQDRDNTLNYLAVGPWRHSGVNYDGSALGALRFAGDTALQFRRDVMLPFLKQHLVDGAPAAGTPPVLWYQTGSNQWQRFAQWPQSVARPAYLQGGFKLSFTRAAAGAPAYDEYVADPAKPVPFVPRPVRMEDETVWKPWLVGDQRFVSDRPDVLSYVSEPLKEPLVLSGAPMVHLQASTSGTDADWVVKVIDVYPDEVPSQPSLGGYQLPLSMDILRGRYRDSFEKPSAIPANKAVKYSFALPPVNHVILPGHRVMIQIQSSWFPLYDRNPQSYVPNIFLAAPGDYRKATQRVFHGSSVELPVLEKP